MSLHSDFVRSVIYRARSIGPPAFPHVLMSEALTCLVPLPVSPNTQRPVGPKRRAELIHILQVTQRLPELALAGHMISNTNMRALRLYTPLFSVHIQLASNPPPRPAIHLSFLSSKSCPRPPQQ